jgi:hypothetical protein
VEWYSRQPHLGLWDAHVVKCKHRAR